MQSDSDSEGEFFDAAESPTSSFSCESSKQRSRKCKKELKSQKHSTDGVPRDQTDTTRENDKHPGGRKELHDKDLTQRTVKQEESKNKDSTYEAGNTVGNDNQLGELDVAQGDQPNQESTDKVEQTVPITSEENVGNAQEENKIEEELRTCEHKEKLCSNEATEQELPAAKVIVSKPNASDVVADVVGKVAEETSTPPVAPPRRRKKKKTVATDVGVEPSNKDVQSMADKENKQPLPPEPAALAASCLHQNFIKQKGLYEPSAGSDDEDNPSIQVNANQQEMKEVLAKTSSTDVVSASKLDKRLKSPSATSMDSFQSVGSVLSVGMIQRTGSLSSLSKTKDDGMLHYRSASGRPLSDIEILDLVQVKNLDTGEAIPLSKAEECIPKCTNPLTMHIMKLTSEYSSNPDVSNQDRVDGGEQMGRKVAKKTKRLKKFLGKTVNKIKSEVKVRKNEYSSSSDEEGPPDSPNSLIKIKSGHGKGPVEFERLELLQDLSKEHVGAVWTIKFSGCGRLMATAGQDHMVRVWVFKEALSYFEEMRTKYKTGDRYSPTNSENNSEEDASSLKEDEGADDGAATDEEPGPFEKTPFWTYCGHSGDVLDLSWSKNYFLLSSSMDKTVRLWHISRSECLCCFQHIDFVTAIVFHPRDDRYFLSGSLDGKIRLWNIPDKKVALWNEVEGTGNNLITAANFCLNGKFAVVGTYDGRCIFYETERLKYHTQWHIKTSRNRKARGRKISGIEPMPGEDKVLITSNDSRIRLYDLKDNSLYCKYKGCTNTSSQIRGSFSHDGNYVICGSEDRFVYIWRTQHGITSARRDKNEFYEGFSAHDAAVTAAVFVPVPWLIIPPDELPTGLPVTSEVLVTADWTGAIKLFVNR